MKKIILFLSIFTIAATALYYGSYRYFYPNTDQQDLKDQSMQAMQGTDAKVTRNTVVVMEYYDKKTERTTYEKLSGYAGLIGYNREQVMQYTKDYMKNVSVEDTQKGLYDFQLVSFGKDEITLRKYYDTPEPKQEEPAFYVGLLDNMVVVYKNDKYRTVYEVTDIDSRLIPPEIANQLSDGMYFDEEYDLYNFLEAYSS